MPGTIRTFWERCPYSWTWTLISLCFCSFIQKILMNAFSVSGTLLIFPTILDFSPFPRQEQPQFIEQVYRISLLETESINENYFKCKWENLIQFQLNFQFQFNFQLKLKNKKAGDRVEDFWSRFQTQRKSGRKKGSSERLQPGDSGPWDSYFHSSLTVGFLVLDSFLW